jgi:hypothetical protein
VVEEARWLSRSNHVPPTLQPCACVVGRLTLREEGIQMNNDMLGHLRQEQKPLQPQFAQSHATAGQDDDVMMRGDMETGVDREVEATLAAHLARALISSAFTAHADTEEQAAPGASADGHSRRAADAVGSSSPSASTASAAAATKSPAGSRPALATAAPPNVSYHQQKMHVASNSQHMKLTFVLEGTNTHLMTDLQLKQLQTLVLLHLLHSQPAQDPGISCYPRRKCVSES